MSTHASETASKEILAAADARFQRYDSAWSKQDHIASIEIGGVTVSNYGDATWEDLADTLERLAGEVRRKAREAQSEQLPGCDGSSMPGAA